MNYPSDYVKVRESTFYSEHVNKDIRILSLGDLHLSKNVTLEHVDKVLKVIEEQKPNYIFILGDTVDTKDELTYDKRLLELEVLIKNCSNMAKTFIIIGNHDYEYDKDNNITSISPIWEGFNSYPNTYLLNDKVYSDDNLFIGGYMQKGDAYYKENSNKEDDNAFYEDLSTKDNLIHNLPDDKYKIFLTHSPEPIQDFKNQELLKDYNLIIAAHYHNGVVPEFLDFLVPKNKGLLTPRRSILPSEARGIVKLLTGTYLMYNGGWTKIPATAKPIEYPLDKFFNRDIDLTTITNNYEYYDMLVKTKKIKL